MAPKRSDQESSLFREAIQDVKPLVHDRHVPERKKAPPIARFTRADRLSILQESLEDDREELLGSGEELSHRRADVPESILRKLRRGQYRIQDELDLHGLTAIEAQQALRRFLSHALEHHIRCVRIVHGKGLRSGHRGPVLRQLVASVLRRTAVVLAYVSARRIDGGTGAVYVLISPRR